MALSKIEKAGMDASKLKDLMNGSGSVPSSPGKEDRSGSEDFDDTDADSLFAFSDTEKEEVNVADENALSELEAEIQALAARESFSDQSNYKDIEPEIDGESDSEIPSDGDKEVDDGDEEEFYEEAIVDLLNELVDAVEEAHETELDDDEGSSNTSEEQEDKDEEEMKYSVETRLEADLEEAKLTCIPESAAPSEIEILLEPEVLINFSTKHRIESEAKTELMDMGKSDTMVLDAGGRSDQAQERNDETASASQDAQPSKKKSKAAMKRKVRW